jgi:ssRNA-specific RNase YbeY (16S rRNA maturation enzyme)
MEELQKQIIAIQLIQELIVDMCDEYGIFTRTEFENRLNIRVVELNKKIEQLNSNVTKKNKATNIISSIVGEA